MLKDKLKVARHHIDNIQSHIKKTYQDVKPHAKKTLHFIKHNPKKVWIIIGATFFIFCGLIALWISTFQMPDLNSFDTRVVTQSTKIYDRTGKILLYDVHQDAKRTVVPFEDISLNIKNATVAIEDATFYQHGGIKISSIIRSFFANIFSGSLSQGGSTITQQVIKNSLLTSEKSISRKLKEWVLSIELEKVMSKDQILSLYLNGVSYGGNTYGVEEAAQMFFATSSADVTLAQAAYIAAIANAPTYYSPYGQNKDKLEIRKNLVLQRMIDNKFITQEEYDAAIKEKVQFQPQAKLGILAPHFVEFIKQYLADKYGEEAMNQKGYKVITTLDYNLQSQMETIVKNYALNKLVNFNASNTAAVAIDPKTGQILAMIGSRDYFDKQIDGNFNVTLAHRQPGSTFKPFVYATAFEKGYTPDTVLFDVPTEFQSTCTPQGEPIDPNAVISSSTACYTPQDFDGLYRGPVSLRNALALSLNIPAIKLLYLAGIKDSLDTARSMGIMSLSSDPNLYGLTLVLGGGEVSLLDMTSAYGVFANDGVRNNYTGILSIQDISGNTLEQYTQNSRQILQPNIAETVSDVLSDNVAKAPEYGLTGSVFEFPGRQVAAKTGTTNDSKDAWTIGYTPNLVIGTWAGNNDNRPMHKNVAGLIVAPLWRQLMDVALATTTPNDFIKPQPIDPTIKPILRGLWQGNDTYFIDKISGKLATDLTPPETKEEVSIPNVHSILYWVDKNDPLGLVPFDPTIDSQFNSWEYGVQTWMTAHPIASTTKPTMLDDVHTQANQPRINITAPLQTIQYGQDNRLGVMISTISRYPIMKANFYLNNELIGTSDDAPFNINFVPSGTNSFVIGANELKVVVYDGVYNQSVATTTINIK
jgi:1A family penicillin-binding protein